MQRGEGLLTVETLWKTEETIQRSPPLSSNLGDAGCLSYVIDGNFSAPKRSFWWFGWFVLLDRYRLYEQNAVIILNAIFFTVGKLD